MTKLRFAGKKRELKEFLDFLTNTWGNVPDREIRDLPDVVCGSDGSRTSCLDGAPSRLQVIETSST